MSPFRIGACAGAYLATLSVGLLIGCASVSAAGQQPDLSSSQDQSQGPLVLQPIPSRVVLAPDYKVTNVNGTTGQLAGAYAGKVIDSTLFLGGGGYWLANQSNNLKMAYGGLILGWQIGADRLVSFGAKSLFGAGQARVSGTVSDFFPSPVTSLMGGFDRHFGDPDFVKGNTRVTFRSSFLIAEPELDVRLRLAERIHLSIGAGYRAIGQAGGLENRLRGATGSIGLQFTVGK